MKFNSVVKGDNWEFKSSNKKLITQGKTGMYMHESNPSLSFAASVRPPIFLENTITFPTPQPFTEVKGKMK